MELNPQIRAIDQTMNPASITSSSLNPSSLTQAAIVIKNLPRWQAASLLARLRAEDCIKLLKAMSQIDQVTSEQLRESLNRLKQDSARWRQTANDPARGTDEAPVLIERRKKQGTISDRASQPFDYLIHTLPKIRQQLLENEHPRNIAMVLASLPPDLASSCLADLDPSTRVSTIRRMCEIEEIDPVELHELNYILKLRHQKLFRRSSRKSSGIKVAIELLSFIDSATQHSILQLLEQTEPELARELELNSFTIDDLIELSDSEMKRLLSKVDTACWAPALKRAAYPLQQKVLANLAAGPRKMLSQQISELIDLDPAVEQQAQRKIIKEALALSRQELT
jgi:flagellar motor switch protein FliG